MALQVAATFIRRNLLVVVLFLTGAANAQTFPDGLVGRWAGAAIQDGTPRLFELSFHRKADGSLGTVLTQPYNRYDQFPFVFVYQAEGGPDGSLRAELFGDEMRLALDLAEGICALRSRLWTGRRHGRTWVRSDS